MEWRARAMEIKRVRPGDRGREFTTWITAIILWVSPLIYASTSNQFKWPANLAWQIEPAQSFLPQSSGRTTANVRKRKVQGPRVWLKLARGDSFISAHKVSRILTKHVNESHCFRKWEQSLGSNLNVLSDSGVGLRLVFPAVVSWICSMRDPHGYHCGWHATRRVILLLLNAG